MCLWLDPVGAQWVKRGAEMGLFQLLFPGKSLGGARYEVENARYEA